MYMALNWQFTDKARFDALTDKEKKDNEIFVWGCLIMDLGEITEKNAEEWHWRFAFASKLNGPYYYKMDAEGKRDHPYIPTLEEVQKRIGLHTNVSNKTRNQFVTKMVKQFKPNG
jgi:hypothetical protein